MLKRWRNYYVKKNGQYLYKILIIRQITIQYCAINASITIYFILLFHEIILLILKLSLKEMYIKLGFNNKD
jgi:hypothetical protein